MRSEPEKQDEKGIPIMVLMVSKTKMVAARAYPNKGVGLYEIGVVGVQVSGVEE